MKNKFRIVVCIIMLILMILRVTVKHGFLILGTHNSAVNRVEGFAATGLWVVTDGPEKILN